MAPVLSLNRGQAAQPQSQETSTDTFALADFSPKGGMRDIALGAARDRADVGSEMQSAAKVSLYDTDQCLDRLSSRLGQQQSPAFRRLCLGAGLSEAA